MHKGGGRWVGSNKVIELKKKKNRIRRNYKKRDIDELGKDKRVKHEREMERERDGVRGKKSTPWEQEDNWREEVGRELRQERTGG